MLRTWSWLEAKRIDDNVEDGLWRIGNALYDFTEFINIHPGGADWIELTKGQDITELFQTHHIFMAKPNYYLAKYKVRDTDKPRNSKLRFEENGFYMTLKQRAADKVRQFDGKRSLTKVRARMLIIENELSWYGNFNVSVLRWRLISRNFDFGCSLHASSKLFVGIFDWRDLYMDRHCWP